MIYKSTKPDTLFIDEEYIDEIGRFNLYIDDGNEYGVNERIFEMKMEFGGNKNLLAIFSLYIECINNYSIAYILNNEI